uniref:Iwr1 domain-containing protein n=1 Tax=Panagrellus redivivus TaxID=6233 RepID=A0A7E5A1L0_PANRE
MNTNGVIIPTERDAASIAFEQWKAEYEEYLTAFSERNANRKLDSQVETSNGVDELEADEVCSVYAFDKDEAAEVKSVTNEDVEVDSDDDEEESDSEEDSSDDDDEADDIWSEYAFDFYGWDEESEYAMDWYTDYDDSEWSSEDELTDADESDAEEDDEVDGGGLECAVNKNADGAVDSNDNDKMCNAEDDLAALSNEDEGGDEKGDEVDDGA